MNEQANLGALFERLRSIDPNATLYSESEDLDAGEGIVVADWNLDGMDSLASELESHGFEIDWPDCVVDCECGKLCGTNPQYMWWQPSYIMFDGFVLCASCIADDPTVLESLRPDETIPEPVAGAIEWTESGFTELESSAPEWKKTAREYLDGIEERAGTGQYIVTAWDHTSPHGIRAYRYDSEDAED